MTGVALVLLLVATKGPRLLANPVECRASEYLDEHGKCAPCRECGPGLELSKECGYGEGGESQCTRCRPRRFKDSWGHHGCKPCLSCSLLNRIQQSPCTATSNAACGDCFPGFYSKTQIGGLQDLECVPCTKQTPPLEPQCRLRASPEKVENPASPALDTALAVLTSSALVIIGLVSILSLLYCQRFWKSQCQRVALRRQEVSGQRGMFQASAGPAGPSRQEQLPNPCSWSIKSLNPPHGSLEEGPAEGVQFFSADEGLRFHLPSRQADWDFSEGITACPKVPQARRPLETRPLLRDSGCSDSSAGGASFMELRQASARDTDDPAPLPSCATEMPHHWPHSPVECTELDLLPGDGACRILRGRAELAPACCGHPTAEGRLTLGSHHSSCSSFRNPTAESGEQLGEDAQSLETEARDVAQVSEERSTAGV